jgi:glycerophosphoryl diester phosphodiesterase
MLTYRVGPQWHDGKLKVIFVGNAPMRTFQQERVSFAAAQGTVDDLAKNYDNKIMPLIGIDFEEEIEWNGVGKMPFDEYKKFKDVVQEAHKQGKKVRVYNLPEEENVWDVMHTAGVDMISSKNPEAFKSFLESRKEE